VQHLFDSLRDAEGGPGCVSVRFYKTQSVATLNTWYRARALEEAGSPLDDAAVCLCLLAVRSTLPTWDSVTTVINVAQTLRVDPPADRSFMYDLLRSLDVDLTVLLDPDKRSGLGLHHRDYPVFFEPELAASALVNEQSAAVLREAGVRSFVAVGAGLPSGDLLLTCLFAAQPIDDRVADRFRSLAPAIKAAVVPFTYRVFEPEGEP
jgi:hypothetical protein